MSAETKKVSVLALVVHSLALVGSFVSIVLILAFIVSLFARDEQTAGARRATGNALLTIMPISMLIGLWMHVAPGFLNGTLYIVLSIGWLLCLLVGAGRGIYAVSQGNTCENYVGFIPFLRPRKKATD